MFLPSLRVNEMESFLSQLETVLDEGAKHALLLVNVIEERTNMTTLVESISGERQRLRGGLHILTFAGKSRILARRGARSDPPCSSGTTRRCNERDIDYAHALPLSTVTVPPDSAKAIRDLGGRCQIIQPASSPRRSCQPSARPHAPRPVRKKIIFDPNGPWFTLPVTCAVRPAAFEEPHDVLDRQALGLGQEPVHEGNGGQRQGGEADRDTAQADRVLSGREHLDQREVGQPVDHRGEGRRLAADLGREDLSLQGPAGAADADGE